MRHGGTVIDPPFLDSWDTGKCKPWFSRLACTRCDTYWSDSLSGWWCRQINASQTPCILKFKKKCMARSGYRDTGLVLVRLGTRTDPIPKLSNHTVKMIFQLERNVFKKKGERPKKASHFSSLLSFTNCIQGYLKMPMRTTKDPTLSSSTKFHVC